MRCENTCRPCLAAPGRGQGPTGSHCAPPCGAGAEEVRAASRLPHALPMVAAPRPPHARSAARLRSLASWSRGQRGRDRRFHPAPRRDTGRCSKARSRASESAACSANGENLPHACAADSRASASRPLRRADADHPMLRGRPDALWRLVRAEHVGPRGRNGRLLRDWARGHRSRGSKHSLLVRHCPSATHTRALREA